MVEGIPQFQAMMRRRLAAAIAAGKAASAQGGETMVQQAGSSFL